MASRKNADYSGEEMKFKNIETTIAGKQPE